MPKEINPKLMEREPKEGPTMLSCTMLVGAGNLPDFSTLAKSSASSVVKSPVI